MRHKIYENKRAIKVILFVFAALLCILFTFDVSFQVLHYIFSNGKGPEPLLQRVKIEHNKVTDIYFDVPKCINYQTIFLDIVFSNKEEEKQFEDDLETCTEQLHDGKKYTYDCLDNPAHWEIYDENNKKIIERKMEKILTMKGKDIYTSSLGKEFYTLFIGKVFLPPPQDKKAAELLPPGKYLLKIHLVDQKNESLEKYVKITSSPLSESAVRCTW